MTDPNAYGETFNEVFDNYNDSLDSLARSVNAALMMMYPDKSFLTKVSWDVRKELGATSVEINTIVNGKQVTIIATPSGVEGASIRDRDSLCVLAVATDSTLEIDNIPESDFLENHSVKTSEWKSWLSAPIHVNHCAVGTVCVLEVQPRAWTDEERDALEDFAHVVGQEIENWSRNAR